uniref:Uncharacterized protein n=1 Tax=Megaselia scalaris TaxID=36166 RepID=T1GMB0_MEGSC
MLQHIDSQFYIMKDSLHIYMASAYSSFCTCFVSYSKKVHAAMEEANQNHHQKRKSQRRSQRKKKLPPPKPKNQVAMERMVLERKRVESQVHSRKDFQLRNATWCDNHYSVR